MNPPDAYPDPAAARKAGAPPWAAYALLLAVYAAGLTHGLSRPWTGMHDWNGAFFAQLARNLLRYPLAIHGGMPLVAVGEAVPPPEERSIYATHPAGLVWLVAGSFVLFGETEWAARLVPIACSLGAVLLWVRRTAQCHGSDTAWLTGLLYATMPMAVYFGRMVNHEPVALFLMLAALTAWTEAVAQPSGARRRRWAWPAWAAATWAMIWVDWSGLLFAALLGAEAVRQHRRGRLSRRALLGMTTVTAAAAATMLTHLVYAGLQGRWQDLWAIFRSRTTTPVGDGLWKDGAAVGTAADYTVENLGWPLLVAAVLGLVVVCGRRVPRNRPTPPDTTVSPADRGSWVLPATGLLWLIVFWRQYELHNYWLFYLGPVVALLAARGVQGLTEAASRWGRRPAESVRIAALLVTVGAGLLGVETYFSRTAYPPEEAAAWGMIRQRTSGEDRVLLFRNPWREEHRGGYVFRNIVPPHLAFYLDRRFAVEGSPESATARADAYAGYVIPIADAIRHGERLLPLRHRFPEEALGTLVWFEFRPSRERSSPD